MLKTSFRKFAVIVFILLGWAATAFPQTVDPSIVGQWSGVQTWSDEAIHMHLLSTGQVLFWSRNPSVYPQIWDPKTDTTSPAAQASYNIFCAGHSFLPDGRLLVTGGHIANDVGFPHASIYDPIANTWTSLPDMNAGRWYPTNTTLSSGDIVVMSGGIDTTVGLNTLPQVWQTASSSWRNLNSALLGLPYYPRSFLAPNGKVFVSGPSQTTRYLDTSGTGAWTTVGNSNYSTRDYGSAVLYDDGKVLLAGGGGGGAPGPTNTAEIIDLKSATPKWSYTGSMSYARRQLNATLLPDGKVLVTGGSSGSAFDDSTSPVHAAELWDPATGNWTTLASNTVYRGYHSTALLLPDGRVVTAGGDVGGATAEIFSPPYLFRGIRPAISSAPGVVNYGGTVLVGTPDAPSISQVTWLRLGSVTHAFNADQRINRLIFAPAMGGLTVTAPTNANLSPPGHYMLFFLNSNGVPSTGSIIKLDNGTGMVPGAPTNLNAAAVSSTQNNLAWPNYASNATGFKIERSLDGNNFAQISAVVATVNSYSDQNLASSTTYYYRLRAFNNYGDSSYSNTANATTSAASLTLSSVTLSPPSVVGGTSSQGTVTLSGPAPAGGAVVMLSSSNTTIATLPADVTVPMGAIGANFMVNTSPVSSSAAVTIGGNYGATQTATLTVTPAASLTLSSLTLSPTSVVGGTSSQGAVTLSGPAPAGGAVVMLSSSNTNAATVPATVTVSAGAASAKFTVKTSAVSSNTGVTIGGIYGATQTATLTVTQAIQNQMANPGFELGNVDWIAGGTGTSMITNNPANAHTGSWYAEMSNPGSGIRNLFATNSSGNRYFPVTPGDTLNWGGWVKRMSGNGYVHIKLVLYDSSKSSPAYLSPTPNNVTTVGTWTHETATTIVPTGKAYASFYAEIFGATIATAMRVDDTSLAVTHAAGATTK